MNTFSVRVRRRSANRWGDGDAGAERVLEGCTRWPRSSNTGIGASVETIDRSDVVTTGWVLSAPPDCGITAADEVQMPDDSTWWQVEGEPLPYDSPFSDWQPGVPIALTRTKG